MRTALTNKRQRRGNPLWLPFVNSLLNYYGKFSMGKHAHTWMYVVRAMQEQLPRGMAPTLPNPRLAIVFWMLLLTIVTNNVNATGFPNWQLDSNLLKGDFKQQKKTKHLRRPIKSSGTLILSSTQGVIWQTVSPVKSTMVITSNHIVTIDSRGNRKKISSGGDLNTVFANALTGNWAVLEKHFTLNTMKKDDKTCVMMTPTSALIKKSFKQMGVCGDKSQIQSMNIVEINGGTTAIEVSLAPYATLTQTEQALFSND